MNSKLIWAVFWALVAVFIVALGVIFIGAPILGSLGTPVNPFFLIILLVPLILLLGVALIVLTLRAKVRGGLKKFLLLTGASAVGGPVSFVLHNLVSGWLGIEEPVFFTIVFICPLAFLVGAIGSIVLFIKKPWLTKKL